MDEMNEILKKIAEVTKKVSRGIGKKLLIPMLIVILIVVILSGCVYFVTVDDGTLKEDDWSSTPYVAGTYTSSVQVASDGSVTTTQTSKELWEKMEKEGGRANLYLEDSKELAKLMNAEIVTQFPDTRSNPDEEIDWDNIDLEEDKLQGNIKFRRADKDGNISTLTYVDESTFYGWIEKYNNSGDATAKANAMSHFTIKSTSNSTSTSGTVQISPDDITTELSQAIVKSSANTPSPGSGWCLKWVGNVYRNANITPDGAYSAYESYTKHFQSEDKNNIPIGASVYGTGRNSNGCGHVGIYIGKDENGNMLIRDNQGSIVTSNLEQWLSWQTDTIGGKTGWLGWGWEMTSVPETYKSSESTPYEATPDEATTDEATSESESTQISSTSTSTNTSTVTHYVEVASWTQTDTILTTDDPDVEEKNKTEYSMTTTQINYKEAVEKYAMPFDLLWAFLVVGEDKDFVMDLAELAYNTKIEITINNNYSKNTDVEKWTYSKSDKVTGSGTLLEAQYNYSATVEPFEDIKDSNYTTTKTIITQVNTVQANITKVDAWNLKYTREYTYKNDSPETTQNSTTKEDTQWEEVTDKLNQDTYQHANISLAEDTIIEEVKANNQDENNINIQRNLDLKQESQYKNIKNEITSTIEKSEYQEQTAITEEKTDPQKNIDPEDVEPNFVTIYNKPEYSSNRANIESAEDWLFEILETNESTSNMVDMIKYFLYKATGQSYGVEEFDFSVYEPGEFTSIGGTGIGSSLSKLTQFICQFENNSMLRYIYEGIGNYETNPIIKSSITKDKKYYKMYEDYGTSNGTKNFGFGVCFYTGHGGDWNNVDNFAEEGINIKDAKYQNYGTSVLPVDVVDRIRDKEIESCRNEVLKALSNRSITLEDYQVDALTNCRYRGGLQYSALDIYKKEGASENFKNAVLDFSCGTTRSKANWTLFTTGKYTDGNGNEMVVYEAFSSGSIMECAKQIDDYMAQNGYVYSLDTSKLKLSFEESKNHKVTCCATYVSWVLTEAGYIEQGSHSTSALADILTTKYNFIKINNQSDLEPGDVLIMEGHSEIYAGNGQVYNAGYTGAIQKTGTTSQSSNTFYYGLRAPN